MTFLQELNEYEMCEESIEVKKISMWYYFTKRIIDIIGSTLGIILLSPVFLILVIIVKIDSKGSAFMVINV